MPKPEQPRTILRISGSEKQAFVQNLITQDVQRAVQDLAYGALLTPQGKYLADFFFFERDEALWFDVLADQAPGLMQRLSMYKLRADVEISIAADINVRCGLSDMPGGAFADPRSDDMGWRAYDANDADNLDWASLRVAHCIPEAGIELGPESYILEHGFERLNGVDFRKGCYVGQEVTARMKHKTELRKGLARVGVSGEAVPGTKIERDGKEVGTLHTVAGDHALAYVRFDRLGDGMTAGDAAVTPA